MSVFYGLVHKRASRDFIIPLLPRMALLGGP